MISENSSNNLYVFGIHDNYYAGIQKLMSVSDEFVQPNYGSAFIFELRQDNCNNYYVRVLNKNTEYPAPISFVENTIEGNYFFLFFFNFLNYFFNFKLYKQGCDALCPVDKFLELLNTPNKVLLPADVEKACVEQ